MWRPAVILYREKRERMQSKSCLPVSKIGWPSLRPLRLGCWPLGLIVLAAMFALHAQTAPALASDDSAATAPSAGDIEFFEARVRPILAEHCQKCHGRQKQWASLRLDSRAALLKGGESGPAIVPGRPSESLLIQAIRQTGDVAMPPDGQLAAEQIAAIEQWIKRGAPWPSGSPGFPQSADHAAHWAFQPIQDPPVPVVDDSVWSGTAIDRFLWEKLSAAGLSPSPPADRRTLIRRVTYDLTGLPPTLAEVDAFVRDSDPTAYEKLIDRLLASPHYGEQQARHWLDVARYSDTKGYVYAREERFFVHAPVYRDWVVRSFNEDLPYDRFLLLQIAADQVAADDRAAWAAMGFLTLGRRFLGVTHDIIDDRIDVVTRGTMGLTVSCARCHDHKYDPTPTADYYSLYGVFQNGTEQLLPIGAPTERDAAYEAFDKELQSRKQKLREGLKARRDEAAQRVRERLADYLFAQCELEKYPEETFGQILQPTDIMPAFVRQWQAWLASAEQENDPIFRPWRELVGLDDDDFAESAARLVQEWAQEDSPNIHPLVLQIFSEPPTSKRETADRYGRLFVEIDRQWRELCAKAQEAGAAVPAALPDPDAEALRQVLYGPHAPCEVPDEAIVSIESYFPTSVTQDLWKLQQQVDRWIIESPLAPPHSVVLVERDRMREPRVFRRGNPATPGDEVPRQFLEVIAGDDRRPFQEGSGRLELARAIVDRGNPLTARVWVNRVWQQHFGHGLVRTPSDFGLRAEPPSHPELLDWLARRLMDDGWSTKALHRRILLSAAYRQRSDGPREPAAVARARQIDPENRLLWRMNVRRLTFEEMRDTLLAVSGQLDRRLGGRSTELFPADGGNVRRTLYGLVDRQFLPDALRIFDFANPDLHIPQRNETSVPQQALFLLNHPFAADQARALVANVAGKPGRQGAGERASEGDKESRRMPSDSSSDDLLGDESMAIRRLYRAVYQREPTMEQQRAALEFLASAREEPQPKIRPEALAWQYGYGELDEEAGRLLSFHTLPHFTGTAWQGGPNWPDAKLGWVQITAEGGHAGNDLKHAAIRRWTAPRKAVVSIESTAGHEVKAGDGVRCWIVSSRDGVLQSAVVHNSQQAFNVASIAVEEGDTIDFVVDFHANLNSDQYQWAPVIRERMVKEDAVADSVKGPPGADAARLAKGETVWNASRDFHGPAVAQLSPWEQLAQVLLLANELYFVD
jgi:mono/diheme cytochrome c family protein